MIRSDMLNSYTQKNKYLNSSTTSFFTFQSDFETKLHQIATLGPILQFQLSWKSGKSQLARWGHEVALLSVSHQFILCNIQYWSEWSACASGRSGHSTWHYFSFFLSLSLSEVVLPKILNLSLGDQTKINNAWKEDNQQWKKTSKYWKFNISATIDQIFLKFQT